MNVNLEYQKIESIDEWSTESIVAKIIYYSSRKTSKNGLNLSLFITDSDCSNSIIKLTIYHDLAMKMNGKFRIGSLITVTNYQVKQCNNIYNSTGHIYELHSTKSTTIETF